MKIEGGCLCGKVRYSADAEPIFVGMCHCSSCQRGSGSAFNIVVALPKPAVSVQGTLVVRRNHRIPYWDDACDNARCARGSISR